MKFFLQISAVAIGVSLILGVAVWDTSNSNDKREAQRQYLSTECIYLGSRIEFGWGTAKFYRYDCDGIIEESVLAPL